MLILTKWGSWWVFAQFPVFIRIRSHSRGAIAYSYAWQSHAKHRKLFLKRSLPAVRSPYSSPAAVTLSATSWELTWGLITSLSGLLSITRLPFLATLSLWGRAEGASVPNQEPCNLFRQLGRRKGSLYVTTYSRILKGRSCLFAFASLRTNRRRLHRTSRWGISAGQ